MAFVITSRARYARARMLFFESCFFYVCPLFGNCLYCYADSKPMHSKGFDMDNETAKKTVDFIWQSPQKKRHLRKALTARIRNSDQMI